MLCVVDDMTRELEIDSVTETYTREGFFRRTNKIIKRNTQQEFAIMYLNLVDFKIINDLYGYEIGDMILNDLVVQLQNSFLKPILVARMVADQFTLLINKRNLDYEKLIKYLHFTYHYESITLDIYGRCGIYLIPHETTLNISDMCDRAKLAKNYISNRYLKPYAVYNEKMKSDHEERSMSLIQLDEAIKNKEFQVYYQPIYDAQTEKIVSAEALVRWHSPTNGVILPSKFIPALEESGYITILDTYVYQSVQEFLEKECQDIPIKISMTLSVNANDFLSTLHQRGNMILMDDFGSGVSSLSTIRDFEFDIIKIDMGFVRNIGYSQSNDSILASLIEMIHRLEMKVVAEGVETKEQLDFLKEHGCDFIQGFYFSKPLIKNDFKKLISN